MTDQDQVFDYGAAYAETEAKEAGDFPCLLPSKRKRRKLPDGGVEVLYDPKYLCELQQPAAVVTPDFPRATARLKFVFRSVNEIPGTKAKGTVFFEIPKFRKPEEAASDIDADIAEGAEYTKRPGFNRESAIEKRLGFQQRIKATVESLRVALGGQDPEVLRQSALVGAKFAIAVDNREQSDGQKNANAIKFFPAAEATA